MTIQNVRAANGVTAVLLSMLTGTNLFEWADSPGIWSGVFLVVLMMYAFLYLIEPVYLQWRYRKTGSVFPRGIPFDYVLLQYRFGVSVAEIKEIEKGLDRPAFSAGNGFFPVRLYLKKGVKDVLNSEQMQGLIATVLAAHVLGRNKILWLTGAAALTSFVFLLLLFLVWYDYQAGVTAILSFVPVLIYLLDYIIMTVSRRLIHTADLFAVRALVFPERILRYLEALWRLEEGGEENEGESGDSEDIEDKKELEAIKVETSRAFPAAAERIGHLSLYYPEARELEKRVRQERENKKH